MFFISFIVFGCKLSEQSEADIKKALSAPDFQPGGPLPPLIPPIEAACFLEEFKQPEAQIVNSVDILFIGDTSGSMANKRLKVAHALHAFVGALPQGTDYRIGMILAHGSNNPSVGELYSHSQSIPKVLDSTLQSQENIQDNLRDIMLAARDYKMEQGEMGSYALLQALSPDKLSKSRELGFFREDAALAVIFIADENDICASYPNPLPAEYKLKSSPYADKPGLTYAELLIRNRDCPGNGISSNEVIHAIKKIKKDKPFIFGAVIHSDINHKASNDSYGWGYAEIVNETHGVLVDISSADYSSGLADLGSLTSIKLQLISDFTLSNQNINKDTIEVTVDRNPVEFEYNKAQNEVHIFELGGALSEIGIEYCLKKPEGNGSDQDSGESGGSDNDGNDYEDSDNESDDGGGDSGGYIGV